MNAALNYPTPKRLFLARHGESLANQQKLISGQMDTPLSEKGRNQALWLCDVLKQEKLSAVYASSLTRAVNTARPTADFHGLAVQPVESLKEIHFGLLQGRSPNPSDTEASSLWQARQEAKETFTIPGSESFPVFQQRILNCFEHLLKVLPDSALIVAHRNTNEVILTRLLGLEVSNGKCVNVKNKYLYEIELNKEISINTIRLGGESHGKKFQGLKDD